ncbi:PfkB family carbohydrate kinase [Prauserella flavalba]|uniref:Carbohydrate kinase PfkB domain-containing protein n=1 Tax=Prauserella flavalba TaxID=1477506 RepID=A0A318LPA3_9PSEU|nr:PfkB family carbohydrate kinase [Prauserella flavalba]PXY35370.1 hypothetical protein BA062_07440 [Prauserella flavalba]
MPTELVAVLSHAVTDEIYGADGEFLAREVGGAGAYAATGASLAGEPWSTVIVSGAGARDRPALVRWFRERQVEPAGLFVHGERSPLTRIRYDHEGERVEEPVFGAEHFAAHTPLPRHLPVPPARLGGVYLFHDTEPRYWAEITAFRQRWHGPLLWEIAADACEPGNVATVRELVTAVDVLSLNVAEARSLLGTTDPAEVHRALGRPGLVLVLRGGADGAVVCADGHLLHAGVAPGAVVDPTGGGNSHSGAFLAAFARTGDARCAARYAAAAASVVIAQNGAPPIDQALRADVTARAGRVRVHP